MVQGLQHVASGWFPATSLSPALVIFWVWYVVQWYICPFAFVVLVLLCLKSCKRRVLLLRWGLSEWLKVIKEAGRLLYCDGLASLKMVWGGGGKWEAAGGSFLSLTHFVHIERHRVLKPSSYVWTGKLAACRPVCIHVLILLPLLSQIYWASTVGCVCVWLEQCIWTYCTARHARTCSDPFP